MGNRPMGETSVGCGKVACWSKKSDNISETRKYRGKVTGGPIGTHQRSFEWYHPWPPTACSSPRLGFATHPNNQKSNRYYPRNGWSYGLQIWSEHVSSEEKPIKNFREKGEWAYSGTAQFFTHKCPSYLWNSWSYGLQMWQVHLRGPFEQNPIKNYGEKGAWAYPGTAQILGV